MQDDCQALLVKFKIEEHRLLNWAKLVQLDYTDERLVLNHMSKGLIMNIMEQQQKLLFSFGRLDKRYGKIKLPLLVEEGRDFVIQNSDRLLENGTNGNVEESEQAVHFPPMDNLVKMSLEFMQGFKNVPKRLRWATFDHKKMEALIDKLANFNNKMHEALDKAQMDLLMDMQTRTNDQIVLLNRSMSHMLQIWQSQQLGYHQQRTLTFYEDSEYDALEEDRPTSPTAARQSFSAHATQNLIHLAIEQPQDLTQSFAEKIHRPDLGKNIRETELKFEDFTTADGNPFPGEEEESIRTEAFFQKKERVWIEWKAPDHSGPMQHEDGIDPKIHDRVKRLAALLNKNNRTVFFRAPFCRGYFIDKDECRFGLVFEKPASVHAETEPISLHSLITASNEPDSDLDIPSLTDRAMLMHLLAETVERLHARDWLHKGLRSANILLFPKENGEINYADPLVSGFDYSRPATSDDMTERPLDNPSADIYRHPTVQSKGNKDDASGRESYKKSFDFYSLGIVLLEIAHWKTIDKILGIDLKTAKVKDTWAVQENLLEKKPKPLKVVKSNCGNTVEEVIKACLMGPEAFGLPRDCDEKRDVISAGLQKAFGEKVVERLAMMKGL